jgi:hypothetical protein
MRRIRTIAAMAAVGLLSAAIGWSPAGADESAPGDSYAPIEGFTPSDGFTSFEARATAEGFRFTFGAPGFVAVDTFIDGGGPVASSVLDGLGNSQSFASLPYPSDNAISGPGLIAGLTGLPSPPTYPFYVNSSFPTQEKAEYAGPGINLQALSAEAATEGTATSGGGGGGSAIGATNAHTTSKRDAGAVIAEAVVTADMVNIGDTLKIASGKVSAMMSRSLTGDPVKASSFKLDGVSIGGQGVGFNEKGFVFAGSGAPIPPDNPLMAALRQAGIDVRYLAATTDDNGIVSPGLVITQKAQFPGSPVMIFTYVLGRARANVTAN